MLKLMSVSKNFLNYYLIRDQQSYEPITKNKFENYC